MKRINYIFLGALMSAFAAQPLIHGAGKLSKKEQKKAMIRFIADMQKAVNKNDKTKAEKIIADAERTFPSFKEISQEDKQNTLELLRESVTTLLNPISTETASEASVQTMGNLGMLENERSALNGALTQIQLFVQEGNTDAASRLYDETVEVLKNDIRYLNDEEKKSFLKQLEKVKPKK